MKSKQPKRRSKEQKERSFYPAIIQERARLRDGKNLGRRELKAQQVLFALLEHYLREGKPVGSQTLKEAEFAHLSSATIRNYFAYLEQEGLLKQVHSSGGRLPTDLAWRLYIDAHPIELPSLEEQAQLNKDFTLLFDEETLGSGQLESGQQTLISKLEHLTQKLSDTLQAAAFIFPPTFEHDHPRQVKLCALEKGRLVALVVTQLGLIYHTSFDLELGFETSEEFAPLERYLQCKMIDPQASDLEHRFLPPPLRPLAQRLYHELMLRHMVSMGRRERPSILTAGLSQLLTQSERSSARELLPVMSFFEHPRCRSALLDACQRGPRAPQVWIGEETQKLLMQARACALFAMPLHIGPRCVGAIGVVSVKRVPYLHILKLLDYIGRQMSSSLTRSYFQHRIEQDLYEPILSEEEEELLDRGREQERRR